MAVAGPKRGHHVINNGVLSIHRDIVNSFIGEHSQYFANDTTYQAIQSRGLISDRLRNIVEHPLPAKICKEIEGMVTDDRGESPDQNAETFGVCKKDLVKMANVVLKNMFLTSVDQGSRINLIVPSLGQVQALVREISQQGCRPPQDGLFVDVGAKNKWIKKTPNGRAKFEECRDEVRKMLRSLADAQEGRDPVLNDIAPELYDIYRRVQSV